MGKTRYIEGSEMMKKGEGKGEINLPWGVAVVVLFRRAFFDDKALQKAQSHSGTNLVVVIIWSNNNNSVISNQWRGAGKGGREKGRECWASRTHLLIGGHKFGRHACTYSWQNWCWHLSAVGKCHQWMIVRMIVSDNQSWTFKGNLGVV